MDGAITLAKIGLVDKPHLNKLALEGNSIGCKGLEAISLALMDNTELVEIYLYNNQLEDECMEVFGKMLTNKVNLYALGMEFNKIGAEGAAFVL